MTAPPRLELKIDVFEHTNQRAQVLADLTPPQLVEAILQEFQELEYIGDSPKHYQLLKAADQKPLVDDHPLHRQVENNDQLFLIEKRLDSLPPSTQSPDADIYLRELNSGQVYKINWLPAIIGRFDQKRPNIPVAVDLSDFKEKLRVSRRHAKIIGSGHRFFIESMSGNPTHLRDETGQTQTVTAERQPLRSGDIIVLKQSNISLKFIVRPATPS